MAYQVRIQDATTGILLKDKFRWVDCEILEGNVSRLTNEGPDTHNVLVENMRAYYIGDKVVEKLNQEKIYYKKQIRVKP